MPRRLSAPWTVVPLDGGFKIQDANGQALAYVYGHTDRGDAEVAKGLTLDEARRVVKGIARLPDLIAQAKGA
jgi:hypothetical protein